MRPLLLITLLCLLLHCQQPDPAPAAPATSESPAPPSAAQVPEPSSTPAPSKAAPVTAATFAEALETYRIEDPTGIRFRGCNFTKLPFPKKAWPQKSGNRRRVDQLYVPGSPNTLQLTEDLLFIHEVQPGQYLVAEEYDQHYHYVELTLVDENLNVLWGPEDVNCQTDEYSSGIEYSVFTAANQLETLQEEWIDTPWPDSLLFQESRTTTAFRPDNGPITNWTYRSYYHRTILSVMEPSPQMPEGSVAFSDRLPWPVDSILPDNSIGLLYLTAATDTTYQLTLRFPFYQRQLIQTLLEKHHYPNSVDGNAYTQDVVLPISPFQLTLFDTLGQLLTLDTLSQLKYRFYCENDGPMIHNPAFDLTIPKVNFPRLPQFLFGSQVVGTAIVNYAPASLPAFKSDSYFSATPDFTFHLSALPTPLFTIHIDEDEAMEDYQCLYLQMAGFAEVQEINCCGP